MTTACNAAVVDHGLRVVVEGLHAEEGPRLRERLLAPVAKGHDLHPGDEGEPGEVVAERHPAHPDDGDADSLVGHGGAKARTRFMLVSKAAGNPRVPGAG